MARITKDDYFMQFLELCEEYDELDEKLFTLVDDKKVKSGVLLVHLSHNSFGYKYITEAHRTWRKRQTPLRMYRRCVSDFKRDLERTRTFIEQIEAGENIPGAVWYTEPSE